MIMMATHLSRAEIPALVAATVLACTVSSSYAIFPAEADTFCPRAEGCVLGYLQSVAIPSTWLSRPASRQVITFVDSCAMSQRPKVPGRQ